MLASKGIRVYGVDKNEEVVQKVNKSIPPFYEPGLKELLQKVSAKSLVATSDVSDAISEALWFL